jgi:hypothetical protein
MNFWNIGLKFHFKLEMLFLFSIGIHSNLFLQFATEFSRFSLRDSGTGKLFQNLLFLIRDWANDDEYTFGYEGGNEYLNEAVFKIKPAHHRNMKQLRRYIKDSYESIKCFLMPHPGSVVAGKKGFNGNWAVIDKNFVDQLRTLIPSMLAPENLAVKKIAGEEVTGESLFWNIKFYLKLFSSTKALNAKSIYESTVTRFLQDLVTKSSEMYKELMINGTLEVQTHDDFDILHLNSKNEVIEFYNSEKKMGADDDIIFHRNSLIGEIEKILNEQNHTIYLRIENNMKTRELEAQRNETLREMQKIEDLRKTQEIAELKANETMLEIQRNIKKLNKKNEEVEVLQNSLKEQKETMDELMKKQEGTIKELHEKQAKDRQEAEEHLQKIREELAEKNRNFAERTEEFTELMEKFNSQDKLISHLQKNNENEEDVSEAHKAKIQMEFEIQKMKLELETMKENNRAKEKEMLRMLQSANKPREPGLLTRFFNVLI